MDKNNWKLKRKEDKYVAVQRWLQEGHSCNTGIENTAEESDDIRKITPDFDMAVSKDVFGRRCNLHLDRLEIHGRPIYRENPKDCQQSHGSDVGTEKGSVDNVLPTLVFTKCATGRKHVTFDNYVTSANETVHRESSSTGKDTKQKESHEKTNRYLVSPSRSDDVIQNVTPPPKDDTDIVLEDFSSHVVVNDQLLARHSATSRQRVVVREDIPSVQSYSSSKSACGQVKGVGWRPGNKRHASGAKTRYLPSNNSGSLETQIPVIRGLVVDIVENQKPSVVRASKNANIREEFALNQKVKSYRNARNNKINTINHAQRKLGANLICLQNRLKLVAFNGQGHKHHGNAPLVGDDRTFAEGDGQTAARIRSDHIELGVQSKGYILGATPLSKTYSFPALLYPQRRSLTIKQGV